MSCCNKKSWFWANVVYLGVAIGLVSYFVAKSDVISHNKLPEFHPKIAFIPQKDLSVKRGEMHPGYGLDTLIQSTPAKIAKGKELFTANCAGCHGADGHGNAALGSRNFADTKSNWINGVHFANIYRSITEGAGKMPSYATLSVPERVALVHYIQTLASYPPADASDKKDLDERFHLSQTAKSANQVPVSRAMEMMVKDAQGSSSSLSLGSSSSSIAK